MCTGLHAPGAPAYSSTNVYNTTAPPPPPPLPATELAANTGCTRRWQQHRPQQRLYTVVQRRPRAAAVTAAEVAAGLLRLQASPRAPPPALSARAPGTPWTAGRTCRPSHSAQTGGCISARAPALKSSAGRQELRILKRGPLHVRGAAALQHSLRCLCEHATRPDGHRPGRPERKLWCAWRRSGQRQCLVRVPCAVALRPSAGRAGGTLSTCSKLAARSTPRIFCASSRLIPLAFAAALTLSGVTPDFCASAPRRLHFRPARFLVGGAQPSRPCQLPASRRPAKRGALTSACRYAWAPARSRTPAPATMRFAKMRAACVGRAKSC